MKTTKTTQATQATVKLPKEVEATIERLIESKVNEMTLSEFVSGKTKADPDPVKSEASVDELKETIKNCSNRTTISEVEQKMIEWHNMLFGHQIEVINRLNPITAFVIGMMTTAGELSQVAGLIASRMMGDTNPYELLVKITKTCYEYKEEHETLEGLVKFFQGLIDMDICDSRITSTKEELEVVLKNI